MGGGVCYAFFLYSIDFGNNDIDRIISIFFFYLSKFCLFTLQNFITCYFFKKYMDVATAAEKLLKVGIGVRVVSICDMNGKLVYHARRRTSNHRLVPSESEVSLKMAASQWKKRKQLVRKLGKCKYAIAEYAHVKRITLPAGKNHLLYVTTNPNFDHKKIIAKARSFK